MNVKLLRKVKAAILKDYQRFKMDYWIDRSDSLAACGTTACIAGWVVLLSKMGKSHCSFGRAATCLAASDYEIPGLATTLLGLDQEDQPFGSNLFYCGRWPLQFASPFEDLAEEFEQENSPAKLMRLRKKMARVAADRIEYFIKTGQ